MVKLTLQQAIEKATIHLNELFHHRKEYVIPEDSIKEYEWGWLMPWCSKEDVIKPSNLRSLMVGTGGLMIDYSGELIQLLGSADPKETIESFSKDVKYKNSRLFLVMPFEARFLVHYKYILNVETKDLLAMKREDGNLWIEKGWRTVEHWQKCLSEKGVETTIIEKKNSTS